MKLSGLPWVSLAALVILVGCLTYFGVLQNFGQPVGPNVYSRSAIGHAGISEILKRRGVPVTASVGASRAKTRRGGLLVLAKKPDRAAGNLSAAEAQINRFLFKILITPPSRDEERDIVRRHSNRSAMPRLADFELRTVLDDARLREMRAAVARITLADALIDYIADVMRATRTHPWLEVGASTRAANMLAAAARATAALQGCDFVPPNDVKFVALPVLRRRLVLNAGAEIEGQGADHILRDILDQTPVPR